MYIIIGGDQKEYGPVSADEVRRWVAEGRLNSQSQVRAEGTAEWKPLASFPEFTQDLHAKTVQAPLPSGSITPISAQAYTAEVLARQPHVGIGSCLSRSLELLKSNFGVLFGATFLIWLIGLIQFVPLGSVVTWILRGVLFGGLYLVFLKCTRGQPAAIGDAFSGFKVGFVQLLLVGIVTGLLSGIATFCCFVLPGIYLYIAWTFSIPLVADKRLEFWSAMELSRKVVTRVWFEVFALVILAFLPFLLANLVIGIKIGVNTASAIQSVLSSGPPDFTRLMSVIFEVGKTNVLWGLIQKLVLLLNLPFAIGALAYAYENLFGARPAQTA